MKEENKTITMYELLGMVKDGKAPKKIKYNDYIYTVKGNAIENFVDYCSEEDEWCFNHYVRYENLNDEVEILEEEPYVEICGSWFTKSEYDKLFLEEEKKIPEKLPYYSMEKIQKAKNKDEWREERITLLEKRVNDLHIKMNDLLDYLKSKGDE